MAKVKSQYQGKNGVFYIVNPSGAVHNCTEEHCRWRLQDARYRLAEDAEIQRFQEATIQRASTPIAEPWSPEPMIEAWVPEAEFDTVELQATDHARELAEEHKIDLSKVEGTGAGGQILKSNVQDYLDKSQKSVE